MKREYHLTVSRTDRIWLIVFVSALLAWELIKPLLPPPKLELVDADNFTIQDSSFETGNSTMEKEEYSKYFRKKYDYKNTEPRYEYDNEDQKVPVNIMEATWQDLRAIGFKPNVASNIERYLATGGSISNESQLMKIYGMDSVQWMAVSPYVIFPEVNDVHLISNAMRKEYTSHDEPILDLNTATAADLEALPGIGPTLAERIIKYRTSLGGFISIQQVGECYGLPPETFEKIMPRIKVVPSYASISINKTDLKNFSHPYLNKKMARILDAYRTQHGAFGGPADLKKVFPSDSNWYEKLLPYLVFE